ncbi:uncharacterized protein LOC134726572 [Mytilus trossulus]|uniref:uncharacterized protein LOC134726572 n=1 Tax=Mytilus trossulus TaxID=6551 RepID=UPI0030076617
MLKTLKKKDGCNPYLPLYSEDDVYTTNSTTTYSKIPADCNLFGSKFRSENSSYKLILNTTDTFTYWVGAKIGFKRNINPLGVLRKCNGTKSRSLDECDSRCKGWKYFCYNEKSCSCSNDYKKKNGLAQTKICDNPENGLCLLSHGVVYERDVDVLNDFLCGAYQFSKQFDNSWIFKTLNCSEKISFICDEDEPSSVQVNSSWLSAEHTCSKRDQHLLQSTEKLGIEIKDGTIYWVSSFRQKKIFWGKDFSNIVCVAAKFEINGSYRLESHFCNESLESLCHKPDASSYGSSKSVILTSSLGTVLGGVLVCVVLVAAIKNRRN